MNKIVKIFQNISLGCMLALFSISCDTRGTGVGAATGGKDDQAGNRTLDQRTGTAAAIVGRPDRDRVVYVLRETDYAADHEGIRLILAETVLFDKEDATLKDDAREKLAEVSDVLHYYGNDPIKISGHADDKGDPNRNKQLSQQRAEAVKQYLVTNHNIPADRIEAVGYGNEMPATGTDSRISFRDRNRENRRVEIKVITSEAVPTMEEADRDG
jgi:outer membrane protein OmpA-like peptidoglycan-associated protein